MKPAFAFRTALGIAVAAILSLALIGVTYQNVRKLIDAGAWITHTQDVLTAADRVMVDLLKTEAAQRNFLLTGQPQYLAPFEAGLDSISAQLVVLRRLVGDSRTQLTRVGELERLIAERVALMRADIELRTRAGLEAAAGAVAEGFSTYQMSAIRAVADELKAQEEDLLRGRRANTQRTARTTLVSLAIGGLLLLLFLAMIWALIRLDLLKRGAAEEEVRRSAGELRTTLRSIGDAVLATDAEGRVVFLNPVAEHLTGWPQAEALGRDVAEVFRIIDERTRDPGEDLVHRVLTEGRVIALSNHMMLVARDGSERPIADSAAPIQDESGAVLGAVLVFRDIAEEREQKRELQRLAAIVSSSSDAIIGESLQGEVTAWNAGAEALFGYSAAEVIGRSVSLLDPPEAEDTTLSRLDRIRKGQRVRQFDTTRLHKDGHRVAVSVSVSPIHDAEGHIVGASKIIRDITERKEAELALRASEERFRVLSSAVTSLVWVCDENGRATYLNLRWYEYTGMSAEDSLGEGWSKPIHPEDVGAGLERWQFSLASGEPFECDLRYRRHDGSYRWFVARAKRIPSRSGPIWVGTSTDIDDMKTTAAALQAAKEAAEEASRAKDRFLAVLSHELRTPLTPALASSQLLERRRDLPEDVRRAVELIRRNVELETLLVDDLLDLTKITRGTIELRRQPEDLHEVLHRCADICRSDLLAKRQKLTLELHAAEHDAQVDAARIQQVFWNLVKNAVKFTPAGGAITIASENPAPGRIRISVSDTGVGIPAGILPRIFEPFEQGPRSISPRASGLGLGLSISRTLVDLHGGTIRAESGGEGKGATLSVELAAFEDRSPATRSRGDRLRRQPRRPLALLLVEDHADTAGALSEILREEGHQVQATASLSEAVEAFRHQPFDLLITDLGLPDGSGHDLLARLRFIRPVKGIVLSGYGMDSDVSKSRAAGFSEHLTKPVQIALLLGAIDRVGAED